MGHPPIRIPVLAALVLAPTFIQSSSLPTTQDGQHQIAQTLKIPSIVTRVETSTLPLKVLPPLSRSVVVAVAVTVTVTVTVAVIAATQTNGPRSAGGSTRGTKCASLTAFNSMLSRTGAAITSHTVTSKSCKNVPGNTIGEMGQKRSNAPENLSLTDTQNLATTASTN